MLFFVSGIVLYFVEENNKFVRFHAMQSIITFLPLSVLGWIFGIAGGSLWLPSYGGFIVFSIFGTLIWILIIVLWLILMLKAYQGEMYKLPIAGDIAENNI